MKVVNFTPKNIGYTFMTACSGTSKIHIKEDEDGFIFTVFANNLDEIKVIIPMLELYIKNNTLHETSMTIEELSKCILKGA